MGCSIKGFIAGSLLTCTSALSFAQQAIMPTGDSITGGQDRPSYRLPLLDELAAAGCSVDMVGDQTLNSFDFRDPLGSPGSHVPPFEPAQGYDTDHQAFPGIRTEQLLNGTSSAFYAVSPLSAYVSAQQPDFVLLHIGTNDLNLAISTGTDTAQEIDTWANQTTGEVDSMIDQIFASHSNPASLRVLLANFIPYQGPFVNQSQIDAAAQASAVFTQKLEDLVAAKGNPRLLIVDVATGFDVATMTTDNVHPNQIGEEHIADAFLPVLYGAGLCSASNIPFISSPANGDTVNGEPLTITWDDNGLVADNWQVFVGDTQSGNSSTWLDSGVLGTGVRSVTVPTLPQDGSNVFISLNYAVGGVSNQIITRFVSEPAGVTSPAITSPSPGTVLPGSTVTFEWADNGTTATQWYFQIGSTFAGEEYISTRIINGAQRSTVFSGLPTDGSRVYVELSHRLPTGVWVSNHMEYNAAGASGNAPPTAVDNTLGPVNVGQTLNLDVLANDSDSDGTLDVGTVTITAQPTEGTATVLSSGQIEYIHGGGTTSGIDTLSYTVRDNDGAASNAARVTISINAPSTGNAPPIAVDDAVGPATIGGALTFDVLANDSDSDGTLVPGTVTITAQPLVGTANVESDGQITYTHDGTSGTLQDVLSYTVQDDKGATSNAATVTITPFNDAGLVQCPAVMPLGNADKGIAVRDGATGTGWLMWSSENVRTRFSPRPLWGNAEHLIAVKYISGIWHVDNNTVLTPFTPASDDCLVAELDFDADTATLLVGVDQTVNGIDSGFSSGNLVVTPNQWDGVFNAGEFSISGTSINKGPIVTNFPPTATDDTAGPIDIGQSLSVNVLANDVDTDGTLDTGSVTITTQPAEGTATALPSGQINYVHGGGATSGSDTFTYTVNDDDGDTSNTATVTISINNPGGPSELTQCPAVMPLGNADKGIAVRDGATGSGWLMWSSENVRTRFSPRPLSGNAEHLIAVKYISGIWHVDNNTVLTPFTPASDDCLVAELDFDADTATLLVGVDQTVNGIDSGFSSGNLVVTPNQWDGVFNAGEFSISGTSINKGPIVTNFPPTATDDTAGPIDIGQSLSVNVLANDVDTDGTLDTGSVTITTQPAEGTATALPSGQINYVHGGGATSGSDTFTYTVNDDDGDTSNTATVTISINNPGGPSELTQCPAVMPLGNADKGIAVRDGATGTGWLMWSSENVRTRFSPRPLSGNAEHLIAVKYISGIWHVDNNTVLTPFTPASDDCLVAELDFDADTATLLVGVDQTVNGIDSGFSSGNLVVTPNQWDGVFNAGEFSISGTSINKGPIVTNFPPTATDDTAGPIDIGQSLSVNVLANDVDTDGTLDTGSVTITTQPAEGTATALPSGQINYVHGGGATSGSDTFTYTVNDDDGDTSNTATVTISINNPGGPSELTQCPAVMPLGNAEKGIAVRDGATGTGWLMWSSENVRNRFSPRPLWGNAEHLIAVKYISGIWHVDNNTVLTPFTPASDDCLVAELDFDADTATLLVGVDQTVNGIDSGFSSGNLVVTPNQWDGVFNAGEFSISGTSINKGPIVTNFPPTATDDTAGPIDIGQSLSVNVLANDVDTDGTVDASSVTITTQPAEGTATALPSGQINYVHGGGATSGSDTFAYTVNDDDSDTSNTATVTISISNPAGPSELTQCPAVMPLGNADKGIAVRDGATGSGWLMWSSENVRTRFSPRPLSGNAEHLIAVKYISGIWHVDNNTVLTPFTPASDDCLVAELDFDADTATLLVGVDQTVNGIDSGFSSGNLVVTPNQWDGVFNSGEFGISGTSIGDNPVGPQPELTDPRPGTQLTDTAVTFNWSANGIAVEAWYVRAGLAIGTTEFTDTRINNPSTTQLLITGLPNDGATTVHVEFSYLLDGVWTTRNFEYTAALIDTPPPVEPPPLVLSEVNWLHADVSGWAETAAMPSVTVNLSANQLCLNHDKANTWPAGQPLLPNNDADLVASAWVFIWNEEDNVWYGATWEWLRPGQICKTASAVDGIHIKKTPYTATSGWEPTSGETLYFMVSGLARNNARNVLERTAPFKVVWP